MYVLLKDHLTFDAVERAVKKTCSYYRNTPSMVHPADGHPLMLVGRMLARRLKDIDED